MKENKTSPFASALLPVALLVAACSSNNTAPIQSSDSPVAGGAVMVACVEGVPGGALVNTVEAAAKVTAIDKAKREVTLTDAAGKSFTATVGPEAINFGQVEVGDMVKATLTQELVVYMGDAQSASADGGGMVAAAAPEGDKPGVVVANASRTTATVAAIDMQNHAATLQFADGSSKTVPVRPDVDLAGHKVGEQVVFQLAEMITIEVANP